MRGGDEVGDDGHADIVLAGLDDAGDGGDRGTGAGADAAIERGCAEIDATLRSSARGRATVIRQPAAVAAEDEIFERVIQDLGVDAVRRDRDVAARHRHGAGVDIGQNGRGDKVDDDGAGECVLGVTAGSATGGDHAGSVAQHRQRLEPGDGRAVDMGVHGIAAAGIADLGIGQRHAGAVLVAVEIKRAAADGDVGGLIGVDIGDVRGASGRPGNRRTRDIGRRRVRNRTDRDRHRCGVASAGCGQGNRHGGQRAAGQRPDVDGGLVGDGGIGNVGRRRIARQRNGDRAGDRRTARRAAGQVERRGPRSVGDDRVVERLDVNHGRVRDGIIGIAVVDRDAVNVRGGVEMRIGDRRTAGDVDGGRRGRTVFLLSFGLGLVERVEFSA